MINIGWIGCGRHARQMLLPQLGRNGFRIAALCDRDAAALGETAANYGVASLHSDYRDLIAQPGLDAIGMAVGPELHRLASIAALEKGLPVFMEKAARSRCGRRARGRGGLATGWQARHRRLHEALRDRQPDRAQRAGRGQLRQGAGPSQAAT